MGTTTPPDTPDGWSALSRRARIAVLTLVAEQIALDRGIADELPALDHGWMAVEGIAGSGTLVAADAFAALVGPADDRIPAGYTDAVHALLDDPPRDEPARAFLQGCPHEYVTLAVATVLDAEMSSTDLTPPIVVRSEFRRRR